MIEKKEKSEEPQEITYKKVGKLTHHKFNDIFLR